MRMEIQRKTATLDQGMIQPGDVAVLYCEGVSLDAAEASITSQARKLLGADVILAFRDETMPTDAKNIVDADNKTVTIYVDEKNKTFTVPPTSFHRVGENGKTVKGFNVCDEIVRGAMDNIIALMDTQEMSRVEPEITEQGVRTNLTPAEAMSLVMNVDTNHQAAMTDILIALGDFKRP